MKSNQRKNLIGDRLRFERARQEMTQQELSALLNRWYGVSLGRVSISKIEAGNRSVTDIELKAIAEVLGQSTDWLVGLKPEEDE